MSHLYRYWRILATGLSFVFFGLGALFIAIPIVVLVYPLPIARTKKCAWTRKGIQGATWLYIHTMLLMGLLTFSFNNRDRLRKPGVLIVANHPSLLDAVFLFSVVPNATCIIKGAMAKNPFTFIVVALANYIPNYIYCEDMIAEATQALENGESLIIFPEGTRTRGDTLNPLLRGAANIALSANCPVVPVHIRCVPPTLRKGEPWYQVPTSRPHFSFDAQEFMIPSEIVDEAKPSGIKVRALTEGMRSVLSLALPSNSSESGFN